jgi:hypothetical protein
VTSNTPSVTEAAEASTAVPPAIVGALESAAINTRVRPLATDPKAPPRRAYPGQQRPDRKGRGAQVRLERLRVDGRIDTDADVHRVNHHVAPVIGDQIDRADPTGADEARGLHGIEGYADASGEVVARAQWDESDRAIRRLAPPPQERQGRVQRAVATDDDEGAPGASAQDDVQVGLKAALDELWLSDLGQLGQHGLDRAPLGPAG